MTNARIVEANGDRVTIAIKRDLVDDYNLHAGELLVTLDAEAAYELGNVLVDTDLGFGNQA